jgi:hypothetical protein
MGHKKTAGQAQLCLHGDKRNPAQFYSIALIIIFDAHAKPCQTRTDEIELANPNLLNAGKTR